MLKREYLIGAGFLILPFLFLSGAVNEPFRVAKEMGLFAFAGIIAAVWLKEKIHPIASLTILFCVYNMCTTGFGPAQKEETLFVIAALAVSYQVLKLNELERKTIIKALVISGLLQAIYGYLQMANLDPIFRRLSTNEFLYPVGFLGQPTLFGPYIAMATTGALFLGWWWVAAICAASALCTTSSFTALSLGVGVLTFAYLTNKTKLLKVIIACGFIGVFSLLIFRNNPIVSNLLYSHNRGYVWSQAIRVTLQNKPITGFGIGSFKAIYYQIEPEVYRRSNGAFLQAHNDYVQIFFEGGFVGLSIALYAVALFIYKLLLNNLSDSQRAFGAIGLCFFVDSLGSFPLYLSPLGLIMAVSLIIVIGRQRESLIEL
jgi:O-antigen ligase